MACGLRRLYWIQFTSGFVACVLSDHLLVGVGIVYFIAAACEKYLLAFSR
jgi:hypothetical protein